MHRADEINQAPYRERLTDDGRPRYFVSRTRERRVVWGRTRRHRERLTDDGCPPTIGDQRLSRQRPTVGFVAWDVHVTGPPKGIDCPVEGYRSWQCPPVN